MSPPTPRKPPRVGGSDGRLYAGEMRLEGTACTLLCRDDPCWTTKVIGDGWMRRYRGSMSFSSQLRRCS